MIFPGLDGDEGGLSDSPAVVLLEQHAYFHAAARQLLCGAFPGACDRLWVSGANPAAGFLEDRGVNMHADRVS